MTKFFIPRVILQAKKGRQHFGNARSGESSVKGVFTLLVNFVINVLSIFKNAGII